MTVELVIVSGTVMVSYEIWVEEVVIITADRGQFACWLTHALLVLLTGLIGDIGSRIGGGIHLRLPACRDTSRGDGLSTASAQMWCTPACKHWKCSSYTS